jgi:uncharacterized protein (TIGR04141 family)
MAKEKLSIYLAKENIISHEALLKAENAKAPVKLSVLDYIAWLYVKKDSFGSSPPWTELFTSRQEVPSNIFGHTSNVGAILLLHQEGRIFILTFGSGYHLLNTDFVERDFGLRVALNSIEPNKLRSVDKANYNHNPLNSRTQSSKEVDIFDLEIDSDAEILSAITGTSVVTKFGINITGRDALTISVETSLEKIPEVLSLALSKFNSKLPPQFEWVDNVKKLKDKENIEILDSLLIDEILLPSSSNTLWLGEPEIVDWEQQIGYSFENYKNSSINPTLQLSDLLAYMKLKKKDITIESLKKQFIYVNNLEYKPIKEWLAYRCLYAELSQGTETYMLRNGEWFQVNADFVDAIDKSLEKLTHYSFKFPEYNHKDEGDYNNSTAATSTDFWLCDKNNIRIGGKYDKIEFCDLIRNNKDLIHIKYYRSSQTLSHLFAQGFVSAETFMRDENFRIKLNDKLPHTARLSNPEDRPNASDYKIIYGIVTNKTIPQELPFFSKITLRNAFTHLHSLGYTVHLSAIGIDSTLLKKQIIKPK